MRVKVSLSGVGGEVHVSPDKEATIRGRGDFPVFVEQFDEKGLGSIFLHQGPNGQCITIDIMPREGDSLIRLQQDSFFDGDGSSLVILRSNGVKGSHMVWECLISAGRGGIWTPIKPGEKLFPGAVKIPMFSREKE